MSRRVCQYCRFSVPSSAHPYREDRNDEVVECRRFPPPGVHAAGNEMLSEAPKVSAWHWCGEWQAQAPDRAGHEADQAPEIKS